GDHGIRISGSKENWSPKQHQKFNQPCFALSQRDYVLQPKVGLPRQRMAHLGFHVLVRNNPNGVASKICGRLAQHLRR
ncbi:MAG: hypothetical protein ACI9VS_003764, partial [Candidatus Binatia bacterium]